MFLILVISVFTACDKRENMKYAVIAPTDTIGYRYVHLDTCEVIITCNVDLNDAYDQKIKIKTNYSLSSMIMFLKNNDPNRPIRIRVKHTKNGWILFNQFAEYADEPMVKFRISEDGKITPL